MKTETMDPVVVASHQSRTILNEERMNGSLMLLESGQEITLSDDSAPQEHVLFVADGSLTVRIGEISHVLNKDQAMHLDAGKTATLCNDTQGWAKVLRLDLPVPAPADPLVVELPRP
jgi:redox-sensitive bicupin YhaK (pirin superfamily)